MRHGTRCFSTGIVVVEAAKVSTAEPRQKAKGVAVFKTKDTEVTSVNREDRFDAFAVGEVDQGGVCEVDILVVIRGERCREQAVPRYQLAQAH